MRTWTLEEGLYTRWTGPKLKGATRVIELEPILDLLEICMQEIGTDEEGDPYPAGMSAYKVLKENDRL